MERKIYYKVIHENSFSKFDTIEAAFHEAMKLHDLKIPFSIIMVEDTIVLSE